MGIFSEIPFIEKIRTAPEITDSVYLVGGAIRDHLMGKPIADIDLTCKNGIKTGRKIADTLGLGFFILDPEHDTCRLIEELPNGKKARYDIAGFRGENIFEDLKGRDLTINAIAVELGSERVIDPTGGVKDIRVKVLKPCSMTSIADDPARILRTIRFANALGFRVDNELLHQISENKHKLTSISEERVRDELVKIFKLNNAHIATQIMDKIGVLEFVLPELRSTKGVSQSSPHVQDVYSHTVSLLRHLSSILQLTAQPYQEESANADLMNGLLVLKLGRFRERLINYYQSSFADGRSRISALKFAGALHDIGKPAVKTIEENGRVRFVGHDALGAKMAAELMTRYKFSNHEVDMVSALVRHHMRFHSLVSRKDSGLEIEDRNIYRYFDRSEGVGVDAILLGLADTRATSEHTLTQAYWRTVLDVAESLLDGYFERSDQVISPTQLLNGTELMRELALTPSPMLGKLLAYLREEQAAGNISDRETAVRFAREKLTTMVEGRP